MSHPRSERLAVWTAMLAMCACMTPVQVRQGDELAAKGDVDGAVKAYQEAIAQAGPTSDVEALQERLRAAVERAVTVHLGVAEAALNSHDLGAAESEVQAAAGMAADELRVTAMQARTGSIRRQGGDAVTNCRTRLQRLSAEPVQAENIAEWQGLLKDLEWLRDWSQAFPEGVTLLRDSAAPIAAYLVGEARQQLALEQPQAAQALVKKALVWVPQDPGALAVQGELDAAAAVLQVVQYGNTLIGEQRFEEATQAFGRALKSSPGLAAARLGLADARRQWLLAILASYAQSDKNGPIAPLLNILDQARSVAAGDAAAQAHVDQVGAPVYARIVPPLRAKLEAAIKQKLAGAVVVYARLILSLQPDDKQALTALERFEPTAQARVDFRVAVPLPQASKAIPSATVAAVQQRLTARLHGSWAAARHVDAYVPLSKKELRRKKIKALDADATLSTDLANLSIERHDTVEHRFKPYIDHTDIVPNPEWSQAQGRQSSALTRLNVATDALRPAQAEVNRAEASLHQLQDQLAEIQKQLKEEDEAFYKGKPSPCPDAKLTCDETRGHKRWSANVAYYQRGIQRETDILLKQNPMLQKQTALVDEAQKAFDTAQKVAAETPRNVPKEIKYDHPYEVTRHDIDLRGRVSLNLGSGNVSKAVGDASVGDALSDYSNDLTEIKGQVLEAQKANTLPDDPTLQAQVIDKLLDGALPPILDVLQRHGERLTQAASKARTELERASALMLVALAGEAVPAPARETALRQLLELTGWDAAAGIAVLERLQPPAAK